MPDLCGCKTPVCLWRYFIFIGAIRRFGFQDMGKTVQNRRFQVLENPSPFIHAQLLRGASDTLLV